LVASWNSALERMAMRKRIRYVVAGVVIVCLGFAVWGATGRGAPAGPVDLKLAETASFGEDRGRGNLVGIQPYMVPSDYATEERFRSKMDGYLAAAKEGGFLGGKTIVVLPEYLGAWLIVAGEKRAVYAAATAQSAMAMLIASNPVRFLRYKVGSRQPVPGAVFTMKAHEMAGIYQRVFSGLASKYAVTIVAGSTLAPNPSVGGSGLVVGDGGLFNVSGIYGPDGRMLGIVRKAFLTGGERPFLTAGEASSNQAFQTTIGRLGVLVCADAWYPQSYQRLQEGRAEVVAVPSFLSSGVDDAWERVWFGYDGPTPADVDQRDVQRLTEGQATMKYALPGRLASSGAKVGMQVFLRGRFWDLRSDGVAIAVSGGEVYETKRVDGATILNLWL